MWAIVKLGENTYVLFNPKFKSNKLCCDEYYVIYDKVCGLVDPLCSDTFLSMDFVIDGSYPKFSMEMI